MPCSPKQPLATAYVRLLPSRHSMSFVKALNLKTQKDLYPRKATA